LDAPSIEQVRRFNRTTTERVGALNDRFLGRDLPLGEARLLWETGEKGARTRELRRRLGLDSAHAGRLMRSLEKRGLIVVKEDGNDGRNSAVRLTDSGIREREELDGRADAFARSLLEPLTDTQRGKLLAAMAQVERLLVASMVQVTVADPTSNDAGWAA
jgi:DNA-binding MarR family transcriptional regulator